MVAWLDKLTKLSSSVRAEVSSPESSKKETTQLGFVGMGSRTRTQRSSWMTGYSSLIGLGKSCRPNVPYARLGRECRTPTQRRAGSQTHKSRRGLGESRYRGTLGDPGASLGQPC